MDHRIGSYNYNRFAQQEPDYVLENAEIATEYLSVISKRSGPAGEITGEQLLQVIRDNSTLVQLLDEMVKNQTGKETGNERGSLAGLTRSGDLFRVGTQDR